MVCFIEWLTGVIIMCAHTNMHGQNAYIIYDSLLCFFFWPLKYFSLCTVFGGRRGFAANGNAFPVILLPLQNNKSPVPSAVNNGGHYNDSLLCALSHFFSALNAFQTKALALPHIFGCSGGMCFVLCSAALCLGAGLQRRFFCMRVSRHNEFKLLKMLHV